jgi:hypothetical protein
MRSILRHVVFVATTLTPLATLAEEPRSALKPVAEKPADKPPADKLATKVEKCDQHGVKKTICARCNAKLEKVFKAKGDWCAEHSRPESQCVLCKPELAKEGVK